MNDAPKFKRPDGKTFLPTDSDLGLALRLEGAQVLMPSRRELISCGASKNGRLIAWFGTGRRRFRSCLQPNRSAEANAMGTNLGGRICLSCSALAVEPDVLDTGIDCRLMNVL